jgi:hypothetical protein
VTGRRVGQLVLLGVLTLAAAAARGLPMTNSANQAIPPLRPPKPELPPTYWELNGFWVMAGSVALLTVVVAALSFLTRRKPIPAPVPAVKARDALEPLAATPETGPVLSRVSQALKQYFRDTFGLPQHELTTTEFSRLVAEDGRFGDPLAAHVTDFLRRCDARKFAPRPPEGSGAAREALRLVDEGETRRRELAQQALPGGTAAPPTPGPRVELAGNDAGTPSR